jgi:hypothetical protein
MFIGPEFAGQAYTRLYLIKNKKDFIFAANLPDLVNKLCSEMVITPPGPVSVQGSDRQYRVLLSQLHPLFAIGPSSLLISL